MIRVLSVLVFASTALFAQTAASTPKIPRPAGNFAIQTAPEKYTWLSEFQGKTCLLAIIETTCPHCQFTTGILNKIQSEYAAKGVTVIASAIEPMSSLHIPNFRMQFQPKFTVGYNEEPYVAKFLGLPENAPFFVPQIVIIDKAGVIRAHLTGDSPEMVQDSQEKNMRALLDKVLAAK